MKRLPLYFLALCTALAPFSPASAAGDFSFGVIPYPTGSAHAETQLGQLIEETDDDNLAFVVANGIKSFDEPCTDKVYQRSKSMLDSAQNGIVVSLAASDWTECRYENGKQAAIARLNRLRDLFFVDEFSLGSTRIPVTRQSTAAKFRAFVENARWEVGKIMFATINLPVNNNHYIFDAGRNSEFEDRLVANRNWLHRVFTFATRGKSEAIVLFCDANPLAIKPQRTERRDGFAETRKQLLSQAADFKGKVLIVHRQGDKSADPDIVWNGNLGQLGISTGWARIIVDHDRKALFAVDHRPAPGATQEASRPRKREGEGVALK